MVLLEFGEYEGGRYQGEWATDEDGALNLHGWGTLVLNPQAGCTLTEGYFQFGRPHGRCREIRESGWYEGDMQDGFKHGEGILSDSK